MGGARPTPRPGRGFTAHLKTRPPGAQPGAEPGIPVDTVGEWLNSGGRAWRVPRHPFGHHPRSRRVGTLRVRPARRRLMSWQGRIPAPSRSVPSPCGAASSGPPGSAIGQSSRRSCPGHGLHNRVIASRTHSLTTGGLPCDLRIRPDHIGTIDPNPVVSERTIWPGAEGSAHVSWLVSSPILGPHRREDPTRWCRLDVVAPLMAPIGP